jgi:hypothetical protein
MTKVISLSEEAYKALKRLTRRRSFSDVMIKIRRNLEPGRGMGWRRDGRGSARREREIATSKEFRV